MKKSAILVFSILIFSSVTLVHAGTAVIDNDINVETDGSNSSVNINVDNEANTGNSVTTNSQQSKTNINIHQEGEGTSQVTVNGKEYKVEGPGDLEVNENSENDNSETSESPTPEEPTPTEEPEQTEQSETGLTNTIQNVIKAQFQKITNSLNKIISTIFGNS